MRMKNYLKMFVAMVAMLATMACGEDLPPQDGPKDDIPLCKVSAEVVAITDAALEFTITSESADEVRYIFAESSETAPTKEAIIAEGVEVEANATVNVKFEYLASSTKYTLHVAAKNSVDFVYAFQEAETEEAGSLEPTISIVVGEVGKTTAKFTVTTTNATEVYYLVSELASADEDTPEGELPTAEEVFAAGEAIEANVAAEVEVVNLEAGNQYLIVVAAEGDGGAVVESEVFNTSYVAPVLSASLTEDIGYDYAVFNVVAENVAEVKYVCIKAGSRDVTVEQVLKNGTTVESSSVKVEGLAEITAYELYVAAKGLNGDVVMADVLTFTTLKNIVVYTMSASTMGSAYQYTAENWYLTFVDDANGYTLNLDFYVDASNKYLPSGEYPLGGFNAGEISSVYTSFMFTPQDISPTQFSSGGVKVVATPDQETRKINYEISGELFFADGNSVVLDFNGLIYGIELPEEVQGAPEGAYVFEVSPETSMPKRVHGSSLKDGEYYIKFYDKNWSELTLDIYVDPALCNNDSDGLPAGTYTIADGSLDTYSNVTLYNPYFGGNFTEAELQVSVDGDVYTFTLLGTAESDSTSKLIYMTYTGEINEMVK